MKNAVAEKQKAKWACYGSFGIFMENQDVNPGEEAQGLFRVCGVFFFSNKTADRLCDIPGVEHVVEKCVEPEHGVISADKLVTGQTVTVTSGDPIRFTGKFISLTSLKMGAVLKFELPDGTIIYTLKKFTRIDKVE